MTRIPPLLRAATCVSLAMFFKPLPTCASPRTWASNDGRTLEGEIIALSGEVITLKTAQGNFEIPLARLAEADQTWAKEWLERQSEAKDKKKADSRIVGNFENLKLGAWPDSIAVDREELEIQVVKEGEDGNEYIYRSPHFEFRSPVRLSTSVVREFSRLFEATFELVKAMPIGLDPQPWGEGYYLTKLYATRQDYSVSGGAPGSAGMFVYSGQGREILSSIIHVPLPNLGVENTGTRFIVDHKKQSDTLIHEITHQLSGRWLLLLPIWFTEGLAETVSSQRYDKGRYTLTSMERAVRESVTKYSPDDREFTMVNLETLMNLSSREWSEAVASGRGGSLNYASSNLLFYYFLRLEGEENGAAMVDYLKALSEGQPEPEARAEILMKGQSYEDLEAEMAKKWRVAGLRLTFQ